MTERKPKVFVSAYACEPGLGSEIGVGWHWVLEMRRYFELWVLTRESNRHNIEGWIAAHPGCSDIHFIYFDLPRWARFWKKGLRGVRIYYNLWQLCTERLVKRIMCDNDIKIFHHLTYGNALWRVSNHGQKQFFVWGPIGGLETIPAEFSRRYTLRARVAERIRRTVVKLLPLNRGFIKRCRNADLILCKTTATLEKIPESEREKCVLFTDVATEEQTGTARDTSEKSDGTTEFITIGRLDAWRGFDLVIESFAMVAQKEQNARLTIMGKGSDGKRLKRLVATLGIEERVCFTGEVEMSEYKRRLARADVVVNASLKEGAVTVSFDSMAAGKPLVCIDTGGYTRCFSNDYAVVIPRLSRAGTIDALQAAMERLCNAEERKNIGEKAKSAGTWFSWEKRGRDFRDLLLKKLEEKK